ncbi:MAG TPA: glycosyltransferase [Mycobacteriales bacterium]|jgi:GT2 family glycosyltransferase|nr:glycosyltransferase [Mycobacteriales bacterium]
MTAQPAVAETLSIGCIVLSQGNRPEELARALATVLAQRDVGVHVTVVGNGWIPEGLPEGVATIALADNAGVPEGRNIGAKASVGDVLLFLDDDIELVGEDLLARAIAQFASDDRLAVLQPRAVDPTDGSTARRHIPRLRVGDPARSGDVAWFWEGAALIRRTAFDAVDGWPGDFFYGHEGIEVAWRLVDAGYRIRYDAGLAVLNPPAVPFRGTRHRYYDARNRVWVARRNLPALLVAGYLVVWIPATLLRGGGTAALRGFADGLRTDVGERRPIRWRTAWRLTRLGRPPVV